MDKKKDPRLDNARIMIRTAAPVVAALFLFLVSAGYIAATGITTSAGRITTSAD